MSARPSRHAYPATATAHRNLLLATTQLAQEKSRRQQVMAKLQNHELLAKKWSVECEALRVKLRDRDAECARWKGAVGKLKAALVGRDEALARQQAQLR